MARIDNLGNFLTDVATSIRTKKGTTNTITPANFDTEIASIETGGITPTGTINITENGSHDVTNYANAEVNVVATGTIDITENGTHDVANYGTANVNVVPTGTINITENGEHDVANYGTANVNVVPTGTIDITENGSHDVTNYGTANVNVDVGVFPTGTLNITANGDYDVTNYANTSVNVPQPSGSTTITANGTYDITDYASAVVDVPGGITVPTSVSFAQDSWETIAAISEAGLAAQYYKIGDKKIINTSEVVDTTSYYKKTWTSKQIRLEIVGFNMYALANDTTKKAGIVLMAYYYGGSEDQPISVGIDRFGWPGYSNLKTYFNTIIKESYPADLKAVIKSVQVPMYYGKASVDKIVTGTEQLWLPGASQLNAPEPEGGTTGCDREASGTLPLPAFGNRTLFERYYNRTDEAGKSFLTGTMGMSNTSVALITNYGKTSNASNSQEYYIRPVFCI